ncbi:13d48410-a715-4a1b-8e52-beb193bef080-CDS [Sclerotinia trifoliorum]|uniref:13d48410-a715-4a1b-8e52-beb193bef080-CDS n=1 Tax=Sclerotinia trifoliorum TaxID=28548 RepID=A0A8H2ZS22_9HELO|nr:13d48410-a715-4a1b-8e52-beb193bef080-CDS [Sclerotinia trifoliorum]
MRISRGDVSDRQARFNGVSWNSSQTCALQQMTDGMIDDPQANFSLPTVDRISSQRTIFRATPIKRHRELLQSFQAAEIDENAEINQMPGANNVRPLPSTQIAEAHSYDVTLKRINELLVSGNANDSDKGTRAQIFVETILQPHIPVTLMTPVLCQIAYMSLAEEKLYY